MKTHLPRGQSTVEALVGMVALASLFMLVPVVGRYQDLALQAQHAASAAAFDAARGAPDAAAHAVSRTFHDASTRWRDGRGRAMLPTSAHVRAGVTQEVDPDARWQLGGSNGQVRTLRRDWQLDRAMVGAQVQVAPLAGTAVGPVAPAIRRYSVVLGHAGHAPDDLGAQSRVAASPTAWSSHAARSTSAARSAAAALSPLDAAWGRPAPQFDWLSPWTGLVPADALRGQ